MLEEKKFADQEFFEIAIAFLAKKAFLLDFESAVKLFGVNLRTAQHEIAYNKLLERFLTVDLKDSNLEKVNFKMFSLLVWTMSHSAERNKVNEIFERYEVLIATKPILSFKEISHLLWAVTLKFKISKVSFEKIVASLKDFLERVYQCDYQELDKLPSMDSLNSKFSSSSSSPDTDPLLEDLNTWEIMNTAWGLSKFESDEGGHLISRLCPIVIHMLQYFSSQELVMLFRVYSDHRYFEDVCVENVGVDNGRIEGSGARLGEAEVKFYDQMIEQVISLSSTLEDDQILVVMYQLVHSKHLQYKDHTPNLKKLYDIREELKRKITVRKDIIEEDLDDAEIKAKRDILYDNIRQTSTRSNLVNKPL